MTCADTAICKHSLDFPIALVSFCTCTGSNMVMVQHRRHLRVPGRAGSVDSGIQHAQTSMLFVPGQRAAVQNIWIFPCFWANPYKKKTKTKKQKKQKTVSKMKWKTIPYCANEKGTAQCIYAVAKINKYLSGSNRERSIGEGMLVPERRTRTFQKTGEKRA